MTTVSDSTSEISINLENFFETKQDVVTQEVVKDIVNTSANNTRATEANISETSQANMEEWDAIVDELLDMQPSLPTLSDCAISRESIYGNHP